MAVIKSSKPQPFGTPEQIEKYREHVKSGPYPKLAGLVLSAMTHNAESLQGDRLGAAAGKS